ncbi:hypothetical protein G9A89_018318 [Geosiphon pyriformis]|nr:hypothetical protein G9A89_018318 [Geosiphon pyriformis]
MCSYFAVKVNSSTGTLFLPKAPFFRNLSDDNTEIVLSEAKFVGSNQLSLVELRVLEKKSFESVKLFALDVELSAVPGKINSDKLIAIKKIFYQIDGFGRALTSSKFPEIIRASFTSEFSMKMAKKLAICEKIIVNDNLKKVNSCSNREVIVKEIPIDFLRSVIESVFSKFGQVILIRMQLIGLWQKALVEFESSDMASLVASKWSVLMDKDSVHVIFAALLYTLPVGIIAYGLSDLLESYGRKTCFIGRNPSLYVHDRCAIVYFVDKTFKLAAIGSILVFKGVNLCWAGLSLAHCTHCKHFGHISIECSLSRNSSACGKRVVTPQDRVYLANIYKKKQVSIVHPVSFGEKTWVQVASNSSSWVVSLNSSGFGSSSSANSVPLVSNSLKCSLKLLADKVSDILNKLSFVKLVLLVSSPHISSLVVVVSVTTNMNSDMALDNTTVSHPFSFSVVADLIVDLSSSSSKVLTTKVSRLEFKMSNDINSMIAKAVNESSFVVLGSDFNKDGSQRYTSFKKCLDLGLVNSLNRSFCVNKSIWANSWGVVKTIDFLFISLNLVNAVVNCEMSDIDNIKASVVQDIVNSGTGFDHIYSALFGARKFYCATKLAEFLRAKEANIRSAIDRRMESFEVDKGYTIRSVLKCSFCKVTLDHLVVDNNLILEPDLVKAKVNVIMESWTRKHKVYVFHKTFSEVMCSIKFDELANVVSDLFDSKAAGLLGVLTNTHPITLIETACKILSKILSNRIFLAYSTFDVLHGDNFLKAYNSVGWEHLKKSLVRIKMCSKFICFFSGIHRDHTNRVMTDFGLTNGYCVHDGLNQEEVFFPLLWHIFYDPLLCKIDDNQKAIQHIFDVVGKFFQINDISINNNKTVVIPINSRANDSSLFISRSLISIAKKVQSESKMASLISFANSGSILGHLFSHRSYDLQVQCWCPIHPLSSPVHIHVNASNNFLVGMVCILLDCNLSLGSFLANFFWFYGRVPMSNILDKSQFLKFSPSLWQYGIVFVDQLHDHHGSVFDWHTFKYWKRLDPRGPVLEWFKLSVVFLNVGGSSLTHPSVLTSVDSLNILDFCDFVSVCDCFSQVHADSLSVYTDGFLNNLETVRCRTGATTFFKDIDVSLGIGVSGLMSLTLMKLQAIALALECVPLLSSVKLFSDSQSALNACRVSWHKVKGHSSVLENEHVDVIASGTSFSSWYFPSHLGKHFILANGSVVSDNSRHFVHDIYHSVCHVHWEVGSGSKFLVNSLLSEVDWLCSSLAASGLTYSSSDILQLLSSCASDLSLSMVLYKDFVFDGWFYKVVAVFYDSKVAGLEIVKFVHSLSLVFRSDVWSVCTKHCAYMEKYGLIPLDDLVFISVSGLASGLSAEMVKLLSVTDAFGVCFGFHKSCLFFSGVSNSVLVYIVA